MVYRPGEVCSRPVGAFGAGAGRPRPDEKGGGGRRRAWATRARVPVRSSSARRRPIYCGAWRAVCGARRAAEAVVWDGEDAPCTPATGARPQPTRASAGSSSSTGASASPPTRRPTERSSACRATSRRTPSRSALCLRARLRPPAQRLVRADQRPHAQDLGDWRIRVTERCVPGRSTASFKSARRFAAAGSRA